MRDSSPARPPAATFRALRHRDYRLFLSGQMVSLTGTWLQMVAQSWLVYRLTGSAWLLGLIGFANQIPVFLLALVGGALADHRDRRRILMITQSAAMLLAFLLAALTLAGTIQVWHLVLFSSLLGVANAFDMPARQAFVAEIVGREDLLNAIALNSSVFNGARILGPALAGVLVASVGEGWCFMINAVSYLAVLAGLGMIRPRPRAPSTEGLGKRIKEGFGFVAGARPVRALLLLLGTVSLLGMPFAVLMPIFADRILHSGSSGLGILMAASGLGAVAGALLLASRQGLRGLGRWVAWSTALFGLFLGAFALSRFFWLSVLLMIPAGMALMVQMASSNTLIQSMVPDELRGRVMALYAMMFIGMAPLGALMAGWLADEVGPPATVLLGGVVCVLAACLFGRHLPSLQGEARRLIVAQAAPPGEPPEEATTGLASLEALRSQAE